MRRQDQLAVTLAVMLALGGCASNEPKQDWQGEHGVAAAVNPDDAKKTPEAEKTAAAAPAVVPPSSNPMPIAFEKLSVSLDEKAKQQIKVVAEYAKKSRRLVVTGHCDRKQVGNPADSAVARAISVRDEFVRLGVSPAIIVVKFDTKVRGKHVAEIQFDH